MHTRARDNALMSGRWNQRMKIMSQGVGICFRIPKSLRLAYISLHSAQHTYGRQRTREWMVLSFPLPRQSTRKVKMPKKCLATTLPLIPGNVCKGQPGGYGQDCSLVPGNMNGAFLNARQEYGRHGESSSTHSTIS